MRKLFLIFLLLPFIANSTIYYVSASDGNDSDNGLTEATAWLTITKVNATDFTAGDQILFKRGDTWAGIGIDGVFNDDGTLGNHIIYGAYGTGAKPIITSRVPLTGWTTSGNWTNSTGNVWWISLASVNFWPRIWFNGTEYKKAATSTVTSTNRYYYDMAADRLYVYATSNPSSFYTLIEFSGANNATITTGNRNYLTFQNLDIRGGEGSSIEVAYGNFFTVEDCDIGRDAARMGLTFTDANDIIIRRNTVDSYCRIAQDFAHHLGLLDGIIGGYNNSRVEIYENTVLDWSHNSIYIAGQDIGATTVDILVYDNFCSSPNVDYSHGFGFDTKAGATVSGNKVYRNVFYDHGSSIVQLNSNGLEFMYNIINKARNTFGESYSIGLAFQGYEGSSPTNMKVYNNIIANCDEPGLVYYHGVSDEAIEDNLIKNNILYNNGKASASGRDHMQISIQDDASIGATTFQNNILYKTGQTDLVYYGTDPANDYPHTVAEFNAENGNNGDVITGNINADPLFTDPDNGDFTLQASSPAKNAGLDLGVDFRYGLNPASIWPLGVLSRLQAGAWDIGAYVYWSSNFIILRARQ